MFGSVRSKRANMAKIPQGEWNAIAARYSKGESLSSIARHYGCTPAAIHYILKRVKGLATEGPALVQAQPATETVPPSRPNGGRSGQSAPRIATKEDTMGEVQPFPSRQHRIERSRARLPP
jgi:hypothetical protein